MMASIEAIALSQALGVYDCNDCKYFAEQKGWRPLCLHPNARRNGADDYFSIDIERKDNGCSQECGPTARNFEPR